MKGSDLIPPERDSRSSLDKKSSKMFASFKIPSFKKAQGKKKMFCFGRSFVAIAQCSSLSLNVCMSQFVPTSPRCCSYTEVGFCWCGGPFGPAIPSVTACSTAQTVSSQAASTWSVLFTNKFPGFLQIHRNHFITYLFIIDNAIK